MNMGRYVFFKTQIFIQVLAGLQSETLIMCLFGCSGVVKGFHQAKRWI